MYLRDKGIPKSINSADQIVGKDGVEFTKGCFKVPIHPIAYENSILSTS